MRPDYTRPHVGPWPYDPAPDVVDELRAGVMPGGPAYAGALPTRLLEAIAPTPVYDQRGAGAGILAPGELVPIAKGIGAAGRIVHVITDGPLAGRVIYRHRPTYRTGSWS